MNEDNNHDPFENYNNIFIAVAAFFIILILIIVISSTSPGQQFIENTSNIESTQHTAIIESIDHADTATIIKTPDGTSIRFPENITENYNKLNIVSEDGEIQYTIKSESDGTVTGYVIDGHTE